MSRLTLPLLVCLLLAHSCLATETPKVDVEALVSSVVDSVMDSSQGKESFVQQFAHQFDEGDTHQQDKANMAAQLHVALCQSVLKMPAESRAGLYESFAQGGVVCNKPQPAPAHDEL